MAIDFHIEGRRSDADIAWIQLGDTDWINRVAGSGAVRGQHMVDDHGFPVLHGVMDGPFGAGMPFEETDSSWVHGRFFRQERRFNSSILQTSCYTFRLDADGDGVIPHVTLEVEPATRLLVPVIATNLSRIRRRWSDLVNALPPPGESGGLTAERALPPTASEALGRWAEEDAEVAGRMRDWFQHARATELQKIRPYALADRWQLDRDDTLQSMLRGVNSGVVELYWSVRCPRCYGQVAAEKSLSDLADHAECTSCRIGFQADLGDNVEVVFAPHPVVVPRIEESYCTLFPAGAERIQASLVVAPGQQRTESVPLYRGMWRIGAGGDEPDRVIDVRDDEGATEIDWTNDFAGEPLVVRAGNVDVRIHNQSEHRRKVQIVRDSEQNDFVPAARVTSFEAFRRTMGHQVLSPEQRITVRSVTLLFTDLSGSTAMYEELGDAQAFAVVRDHFTLLSRVTEAHRGTQVKTIGDAIMAAFHDPCDAMRAGIEMIETFKAWAHDLELEHPPGLRVGMHMGPALCVHSEASGLDYFGRTVNIAARAEGQANPGQLVWTDALNGLETVQNVLSERGLEGRPVEADLKGIRGSVRLYRTDVARFGADA